MIREIIKESKIEDKIDNLLKKRFSLMSTDISKAVLDFLIQEIFNVTLKYHQAKSNVYQTPCDFEINLTTLYSRKGGWKIIIEKDVTTSIYETKELTFKNFKKEIAKLIKFFEKECPKIIKKSKIS